MNPLSLVGAFGIKITPEQQAQINSLLEQLPATVQRLKRSLRTHEVAHGLLSGPVPPHDPLKLPERHIAGGGFARDFTLETALGKPVTRGSLRNIGSEPVTVRLYGLNDQMSEFPLLPGQVEDTSSYVYTALDVEGSADARVLVSAQ